MNTLYILSIILNLCILLFILYLSINGKRYIRAFILKYVINVRHEQRLSMFTSCPDKKGAIIFLGNSITEGAHWNELFENNEILNRGIGGDTSMGVLKRINEITRHQPSKLFICIGTNDIAFGIKIADVISNYQLIIDSIKKRTPNTKIYIQSVLPVGKKVILGHNNESIIKLNQEIKKMCIESTITYVDLHKAFTNKEGCLKEEYTNDKLHIMGNAYLVWKQLITPYINE